MSELIQIQFRGDALALIENDDGNPYVAVKPICEIIGLDWSRQYRKLTSQPRWGIAQMATPSAGGVQQTTCIPLAKLFGWLATISENRVAPEVAPKLRAYQAECDQVLFDHWITRARARATQTEALRGLLLAEKPLWSKIERLAGQGFSTPEIATLLNRSRPETERLLALLFDLGVTATLPEGTRRPDPDTRQGALALEEMTDA